MYYIRTRQELPRVLEELADAKHVAFDLETTGLDPFSDEILLAQFHRPGGECWVVNCQTAAIADVLELLATKIVIAHNATFEYKWIYQKFGIRLSRVFCTKLAEQVLTAGFDGQTADLEATARRRLGVELDKMQQTSFIGADPATFSPTAAQLEYAAQDVLILPALRLAQCERLKAEGLVPTAKLEFDTLPAFAEMELAGMRLNLEAHDRVLVPLAADVEHYGNQAASALDACWQQVAARKEAENARQYADYQFHLDGHLAQYGGRLPKDASPELREAVAYLRKERGKVKPKPPAPINLSSSEQVLAALAESGINLPNLQAATVQENAHRSPVLGAYATYAKASKIVSTYGESLAQQINPRTGRIHAHFNQVVSTGRTSSSGPNMQNMPKAIRACFEAAEGHSLVVADFANMELRIAAGLSGDPNMLAAFENNQDLHCMTAAAANPDKYPTWKDVPKDSPDRSAAKTANFAVIYGSGSIEPHIVEGIQRAYPVLWAWLQQQQTDATTLGYACTAIGRKRYFPKLPPQPNGWAQRREWLRLRGAIARQGGNHPVQGTGADIAKLSMVLVWQQVVVAGLGRLVNLVHDELVIEVPDELAASVAETVAAAMREAGRQIVPLVVVPADVHIVKNWTK